MTEGTATGKISRPGKRIAKKQTNGDKRTFIVNLADERETAAKTQD